MIRLSRSTRRRRHPSRRARRCLRRQISWPTRGPRRVESRRRPSYESSARAVSGTCRRDRSVFGSAVTTPSETRRWTRDGAYVLEARRPLPHALQGTRAVEQGTRAAELLVLSSEQGSDPHRGRRPTRARVVLDVDDLRVPNRDPMRPVVTLPVPVGPRKQDNVNIPLVLDQVDASVMIASALSPVDPVFQDPTGLVGSVSGRRRAPESASPAAPFHLCVHQSDERLGVRRHQGFVPGSNFVEHDSHGSACSLGRQATPTFARSLRAAIPAMWQRSRKRRSSAPNAATRNERRCP